MRSAQSEKENFYRLLVSKDLAEINAYWARLTFSGCTVPPRQATSNEEMLGLVAGSPGGVGYLERAKIDARVKIVYEFTP